jgi:hypothetical protein
MMQPAAALHLNLPIAAADHFSVLFSAGMGIRTIAGISLTDLLCRQLAIDPEYVERRIQTIFLNHRAVDHTEQVIVPAGSVLALSAAMPGLVGATFRKGGVLADFRKDISYQTITPHDDIREETLITLKLFNLVARELGPHLLSLGVWIDSPILKPLLLQLQAAAPMPIEACQWNGQALPPTQLSKLSWPEGWITLSVIWQPSL